MLVASNEPLDRYLKESLSEHLNINDTFKKLAEIINSLPHDEQIARISEHPYLIGHVIDPDEELQLAAVSRNPGTIEKIKNPQADK